MLDLRLATYYRKDSVLTQVMITTLYEKNPNEYLENIPAQLSPRASPNAPLAFSIPNSFRRQ